MARASPTLPRLRAPPAPQDEFFPADLLFLSAGSEDGLCYIETMQLDGETNLKIKKAPDETKHLNAEALRTFQVARVAATPARLAAVRASASRSCEAG